MHGIIEGVGTGKTRRLMEYAKDNNCILLVKNPTAMMNKAHNYGIIGLDIRGYEDIDTVEGSFVIDELEQFLSYWSNGTLVGYTLTKGN